MLMFKYMQQTCWLSSFYFVILTNLYMFMLQFIGSLDVPRPVNRVEIVAAMRRIRVSVFRRFFIKT